MFVEDHLALRLIQLKPSEDWGDNKQGLSFIFCKDGIGKCVSKNGIQRLVPGNVLAFSKDSGCKLSVFDRDNFSFNSFSLLPEHLFPLFGSNEISLLQNVIDSFKAIRIYPGNSATAQDCQQLLETVSVEPDLKHRGQLLRIVTVILSVEFKEAQAQRGGFSRTEDRMISLFEKLPAAELLKLSVEELAVKFNCSRRHLTRQFQQCFGLSVAALKMEMRLLNAISLLRNPQMKVIHVAEQCGFNHLGLFNTCFKRRFGASPGQWRKLNLQTENTLARKSENRNLCPLHANGLCSWSGQFKPVTSEDATIQIISSTNAGGGISVLRT